MTARQEYYAYLNKIDNNIDKRVLYYVTDLELKNEELRRALRDRESDIDLLTGRDS